MEENYPDIEVFRSAATRCLQTHLTLPLHAYFFAHFLRKRDHAKIQCLTRAPVHVTAGDLLHLVCEENSSTEQINEQNSLRGRKKNALGNLKVEVKLSCFHLKKKMKIEYFSCRWGPKRFFHLPCFRIVDESRN